LRATTSLKLVTLPPNTSAPETQHSHSAQSLSTVTRHRDSETERHTDRHEVRKTKRKTRQSCIVSSCGSWHHLPLHRILLFLFPLCVSVSLC
jgi:hypothetical protein